MSYVRADDVLPEELIKTIQQYISGETIYIPAKEKKDWGSQTNAAQYYKTRNTEICLRYKEGVSIRELSDHYSLSEKSIQRILRNTHTEKEDPRRL